MGKPEGRTKAQHTAAELVKRGYPHGRRQSRPSPNSGGLTMVNRPGSTRYHRFVDNPKNKKR